MARATTPFPQRRAAWRARAATRSHREQGLPAGRAPIASARRAHLDQPVSGSTPRRREVFVTSTPTARTANRDWLATALADQISDAGSGPQRQTFVHAGTHAGITARWIVMPPGHSALMHAHAESVIVVSVVAGHVASVLVSPTLGLATEHHGPGDVIIIDQGVLHLGVNLSTDDPVVLSEVGTSERFHHDVICHDEWDRPAGQLSEQLQARFTPDAAGGSTVADLLIGHLLPEYQR